MYIFVGVSWSFMSKGVTVTVSFLSIIALVAVVPPAVFLGLAVFSDNFLQFTDAIK
jgi:amino acid transporter